MKRPGLFDQARRARKVWREAWSDYQGWRAMLTSPYFLVAVLIAAGCYPLWLGETWADVAIAIVPSVLGFSIGGFAIFLAFGDERFRYLIRGRDEDGALSPFMAVCTQFVHFISVQVGTLVIAMLGKGIAILSIQWLNLGLGALGTLGTCYSVTLALAAVASLLKLARGYDRFAENLKKKEADAESTAPTE